MGKKLRHLTMRVSEEWLLGLRTICKSKARTVTAHVERCVELAKVVDELCHGTDDPAVLKKYLVCKRTHKKIRRPAPK